MNSSGAPKLGLATRVARKIIQLGQFTPLRGRGGYGTLGGRPDGTSISFPQAATEALRVDDFFGFFGQMDVRAELAGKDVLDFGSGYGGRTVEYARSCGARFVWGVEPFENIVAQSRGYAQLKSVKNVDFVVCGRTEIPLADDSIDIVISYDVLEHVDDPRLSMLEIHRVLRPEGTAFLVFPVYFGAFSHHLDYITLIPGLHWIFSPETLIVAINSILESGGADRFGTDLQPPPKRSFDGARLVLPSLNGLGGENLSELFRGFETISLHRHGWLKRRQRPSAIMQMISGTIRAGRVVDAFTSSISCVLRKPLT